MDLGFIDESWIHWWILIFIVGHPIFIVGHLFFCWGHFWKYKPPGGLPGTNPGFWETQISSKSRVCKRFGWFILMICCYLSGTDNSVALTFQGGSYDYVTKFIVYEKWGDHWFFGPPPPQDWENNKQIHVSDVLWDQMVPKFDWNPSHTFSPPLPPTRIP